MTAWQARQARLTETLTTRMGRDVVFTRRTGGTHSELTGTTTSPTETTQTVSCRLEPEDQSHDTVGGGGRKRTTTRTLTATAADFTEFDPAVGDRAEVPDARGGEGRDYTVANVEAIHDGASYRITLSRVG